MENFYQSMLFNIKKHLFLKNTFINFTRYIPVLTFIIYPVVIIYLFFTNNPLLLETIIRPCIAFTVVTIFRKIINRKRPYEAMDIEPLIKHKQGESFPSRHTVSCFCLFKSFFTTWYRYAITSNHCQFITDTLWRSLYQ